MEDKLKIISFNVKGMKGPEKRAKVLEWLSQKKADVVLKQESHFEEVDRTKWEGGWNGSIYASQGANNARGVCTLINARLNFEFVKTYKDADGRWLIVVVKIKDQEYCISNYYGPNLDKTEVMEQMLSKIDELDIGRSIVGGDFNFVYNVEIDKSGGNKSTNTKCRDAMLSWQGKHDCRDIWRERNPHKRQYTWISNTKPRIQCRLDHILIPQQLAGLVCEAKISPGYSSDHSLVSITLTFGKSMKGRGFWKFNSSLLEHNEFTEKIKECIRRTEEENNPCSPCTLWDVTKCNIRRECILFSTKLKKERNLVEREVEEKLEELEGMRDVQIDNKLDVREIEEEISKYRAELDKTIKQKCRGAAIRSKCKNYEFGEKATRYFLNLEKQKGEKQSINSLLKEDGTTTFDQKEILNEQFKFYKNLYANKDIALENTAEESWEKLFQLDSPKVDMEDHEELTNPITEEEIRKIVSKCPTEKSPGIDGFTHEFYKHFWEDIKHLLIATYNESLERGRLCISQCRGVISLLPKEGKDVRLLKNWRPITLLNNDYKYLAKAISLRCRDILPYIIGEDQNGFVKGRLIGCNIIRLLDIIETCKEEDIEGLLVNIDIEKAFDSVSWRFLYEALKYFNFPETFINWVKCLYNEGEICTINNGHASEFIKLGRGMRQGCPLSPILFVICIELLSIYVKNNKEVEGLHIKGETHLISQFADDTSFFIQPNLTNLENLLQQLETFGLISGLKVNIEKTELFTLGNRDLKNRLGKHGQLLKETVKVLGCKIEKSIKESVNTNYNEAFDKMIKALNFWGKKPLSLVGKINMIKCHIIPKLLYCMTVLPSPEESYWKNVEKELFRFISNNKQEKLKRTTLINTHNQGGAQMIDITSQNKAIKGMWLLKASILPGPWTFKLRKSLGQIEVENLVKGNLCFKDIKHKIPGRSIWYESTRNWCEANHRPEIDNTHDIAEEHLWLNSNIKINGKTLYKKEWIQRGIMQIWDLLRQDGKNLLGYREFSERYQIGTNFLEYGSLKKAIPGIWRRTLRESAIKPDPERAYEGLVQECRRKKLKAQTLYKRFLANKATKPVEKLERWKSELNVEKDEKTLLKVMEKNRTCTVYSKLQSFNYNFYNRNLVYEARLHKMKLEDNDKCKICGDKESLLHLYWECPATKTLWTYLDDRIYQKCGVIPSKKLCILGIVEEDTQYPLLLRTVNLICRYYIHVTKCQGSRRTTRGLWNAIINSKSIETTIETEKGRRNNIQTKWEIIV
jgi:exonuclease III